MAMGFRARSAIALPRNLFFRPNSKPKADTRGPQAALLGRSARLAPPREMRYQAKKKPWPISGGNAP
jgi:hypothetical protein